jgi:hypothetical protein
MRTVPYIDADPVDIVPRAYDMFRAYEGMEGRKIKNKVITIYENLIQNKIQFFLKAKVLL